MHLLRTNKIQKMNLLSHLRASMRPPSSQNLDVFFNEWTDSLRKAKKKLFNLKSLINKLTSFANN